MLPLFILVTDGAALEPDQVAVIINESDPLSVAIGEYYADRRAIPAANVIRTNFKDSIPVLASGHFKQIYAAVRAATAAGVQAYALTWLEPYRVDCMSIGTAFAMGFGKRHCAKECRPTAPNPYFDSSTRAPYDEHRVRPTMTIAARTLENAKLLIERGIRSDYTRPVNARAYLVVTDDGRRNSRAGGFVAARRNFNRLIPVEIAYTAGIRDKSDIMFYFTGARQIPDLDTLGFLPGAAADHLTSAGGRLTGSKQMSALRWLEAGATGSYGTVTEPCNFPQKFPDPAVMLKYYLAGETLIEAYWKSVIWPGQGIFIGEPLAKPFAMQE